MPRSNNTPPTKLPLWAVTGLAFLTALLASLVYVFIKRPGSKTRPKNEPPAPILTPTGPVETPPARIEPPAPIAVPAEVAGTRGLEWVKSLGGPFLALVIAYVAQGIYGSTFGEGWMQNWAWLGGISVSNRLWLGSAFYLAALLVWVFKAPDMQSVRAVSGRQDPQTSPYQPLRFYLLYTGFGIYILYILMFMTGGETGLIRGLWAAGLLCFILSQVPWPGSHESPQPEAEESPRFRWQDWLVLVLILGVAFGLRFYKLASIPDDLHGDMSSYGLVARDYLLGVEKNIFGYGFYDIPIMGFLPSIFSMAVFGNDIFGLQMASLVGGLVSLLAVYLLIWRLFNSHRLAALTMALVAINVAHIHFSRIAAYMDPWPFGYLALFFMLDGLKARRASSLGLAGVFLGFCFQMYFSGRVLVFIIGFFLIHAFFFQRSWITQNKRGLSLMAAGVMLALGPALVFHLTHWDGLVSRSREVFVLAPGALEHSLNKYDTTSPLVMLLTQARLTLLMFNQSRDTSSQFGFPHPGFNSLISPLIVLGLGIALRRWKESGMAFILGWLGITAVLGSVLTVDAPFWPRLVGILPAAAFLIAVVFDQLFELGRRTFGAHAGRAAAILLVILLAVVGIVNWDQYYQYARDNGSVTSLTGRYIARLPLNVTACSLLSGPPLIVRETAFLAWPHKLVDIKPDAPDADLEACTGPSIVWVISPENTGRLDAIRARWPNGIIQNYDFPRSNYTLTFYLVNAASPVSPVESPNNFFPWFLYALYIIVTFVLCTGLIWLFLRPFINKRRSAPAPKLSAAPAARVVQEAPRHSGSLRDELAAASAGFKTWVDELRAFRFTALNSNMVPPALLAIAALGLAYFAQTFFDQNKRDGLHLSIPSLYLSPESRLLGTACFLFLVAALIWSFTTADKEVPSAGRTAAGTQPAAHNPFNSLPLAGVYITLGAMLIYAVFGETSLTRWGWAAGLIVFLTSLYLKRQLDKPGSGDESPAFRWPHILALALLLVLAFYLRVYRLYDIPLDLSTDMASVGLSARDYLLGAEHRIFGTGWYYYPRLVFLPYVLSMKLAGNDLFGLYFGTVIMGTLNILGTYLFVWRSFDRHRLALLTAVLLAINPAHIEYSRIVSYVDPWFLGFFGLYFFVDGLKGRRKVPLALAGLLTGFTLVSYPSGRAIIPMLAMALAFFWFHKRQWVTENYAGLVWMALGLLAALGPNLVYMLANWSVYMQRSGEVLIFRPDNIEHLKFTYSVDSVRLVIWEQVKRSVLQFNYYTDRSAQFYYPHPMFNSLVSPLLILGFGMGLVRWRKPEYLFVLSSFMFILVVGGILTNDAPTWSRLVGIIPLAALLIAWVLDEVVVLFERIALQPLIPILLLGMTVFLGVLALTDWRIYLRDVGDVNTTRPEVFVARYLDSLPDGINACGITEGYHMDQEEIRFLGWPRTIVDVAPDTALLTSDICPGTEVVWILSPANTGRLPEIQSQWPNGVVVAHKLNNGILVFTSYLVSSPSH